MGWQDAPIVKPAAKKRAAWEDAPIVRRNEQAAPTPPEKPALTLASAAFPNARGEAPSPIPYPMSYGVLPKDVMYQPPRGAGVIGDALSLPTRAAGAAGGLLGYSGATGGKQGLEALADPETGLARPVRQWSGGLVSSGLSGGEDGRRGLLDYGKVAAGAITYLAASVVEDPTSWLAFGAKPAATVAAKGGRGVQKAAGGIDRMAGRWAEELSGVSEDALRTASTKAGRESLKAATGKQKFIGDRLLSLIENADDAMPEAAKVQEALGKMGDISLESAIKSLESAKVKPAAGGRLFPNEIAANAKIDTYIDVLRGGKPLPDFARGAMDARVAAAQAEADKATKAAQEAQSLKAAAKAAKSKEYAVSRAGKTAAEAGKTKKEFLAAADKADKNVTRFGRARNEAGQSAESALEEAREAATKARQAAQDATAKEAIGKISKADADIARAVAGATERRADIAEAAYRISKGERLEVMAKEMAERGYSADDMSEILVKARSKVESAPKLPEQSVSATEYRDLRKRMDVNIDFDTEEGMLVNNALKRGRTTMKDALIQKARESGNPEYERLMQTWSDKLSKIDELTSLAGSTETVRKRRIESLIANLFGKNSAYKQQLIKDLDDIFGSNILGDAKLAAQAAEIGAGGKPALLPRQYTGRSLLGLTLAPGVTLPLASPAAASRILGFTRKLAAARNPGEAAFYVGKLKAIGLTAAEIEALTAGSEILQTPNAIPFRKVAEKDSTQPVAMRK